VSQTVLLPSGGRFFEIRFESIGGLGAHAAGQVLATAAVVKMGLNGAHFSSYGSEKKGSLVRSFVRLGPADRPIRTSAPVEMPDAIVVFHAALLGNPATFAGLYKDGTFIYNAPPRSVPEELAALPSTVRAIRVDALGIAVKEKSRPNAVLLGTLCGAFPFLGAEEVLEALSEEFAGKAAPVSRKDRTTMNCYDEHFKAAIEMWKRFRLCYERGNDPRQVHVCFSSSANNFEIQKHAIEERCTPEETDDNLYKDMRTGRFSARHSGRRH